VEKQNIPPQIHFFGVFQVGYSEQLQTSADMGMALKGQSFVKEIYIYKKLYVREVNDPTFPSDIHLPFLLGKIFSQEEEMRV
jgi:hypothetical protein